MPSALRKLISILLNGKPFSRSAIHVLWAKGPTFQKQPCGEVLPCSYGSFHAFQGEQVKYDDDIWQPTFETVEEQKLVLWKILCWASTLFHPRFARISTGIHIGICKR
jgi:hypothetical protein